MKLTADEIRQKIAQAIPEGSVITKHNDFGHFYEVPASDGSRVVYPSVTGKLQILKDESLINHKAKQALQYVFEHFTKFTEANIMEHLDKASKRADDGRDQAGHIGTQIHDYREEFFRKWILTGKRPEHILSLIPEEHYDTRSVSALRALDKFCSDFDYVPVATELYVYSHKIKLAGALDDLGIMRRVIRAGNPACAHDMVGSHCVKCDYKEVREFVLMDIKTSNQFKDHYFFQVALYYWMFYQLTGLKPQRCFILKLSKEDGTYKIEDLKRPGKLAQYSRHMLKTNEAVEFIKSLRKDNQKKVLKI